MSFHCILTFIISSVKSVVCPIGVLLYAKKILFLAAFNIFSFSVVYNVFTILCLNVVLPVFFPPVVH